MGTEQKTPANPAAKKKAPRSTRRSPRSSSSATRKKKPLAAKLADVQFEISKNPPAAKGHADVYKDGALQYSYDYVRESDLMRAIAPLLAMRNVAVLYSDAIIDRPSKDDPTTTVSVSIRFIDGDSNESIEISGDGYAFDRGDRGANKAKTHAVRYLLWKTFLVPADEDPEAEGTEDVPRHRAEPAAESSQTTRETTPARARPSRSPERSGRLERSQRRERLITRLREVAEEADARRGWEPGTSLEAALANYGTGEIENLSDDELVAAGVELSNDAPDSDEPNDPDSDVPF